jgi:glycosyltransferase involved in cell wall biosynthesis
VIITRAHAAAAFVWPEVTGYLAEESAAGFAAAALWMFADFDRCRWIGESGRKAVGDAFGWPAVAARLLDCYRRAAAESLRPDLVGAGTPARRA